KLKQLEAARFDKLAKSLPRSLKLHSPFSRIEACRSLSVPAADRYPDGEIDWIYIDADHSYEGALADLRAWAPKLREDGLILGHDFTDQADSFGVIRAVADFVASTDYRFLCLTTDYFPTFVLSRSMTGTTEKLLRSLFSSERFLYQLDTKAILSVHHQRYPRGASKTGVLSTFLPQG
ncbi:MAG: class I SAM-dependent methyltransferase, partial [Inquilinus sp.]|nr:class I SAM-dependent methyltransferase [Inquilinus sp.]